MNSGRIVIAGAGIGGLTAALALAARGVPNLVLEQAERLEPIGAGVQLSPNASRLLIAMGLKDALAARSVVPEAVALNSVRAGGLVARLPLRQTAAAPYWVMHRAALQDVLCAAATAHPAIELRLGAQVANVALGPDAVDVTARHGDATETFHAEALIGADGVRSRVRQAINPAAVPCDLLGHVAWRGIADVTEPCSDVQVWMGANAHLVAYPVSHDRQINLVVTLPAGFNTGGQSGGTIATALAEAGWPDQPCRLIDAALHLTPYPLLTLPLPQTTSHGRVTLIGDAGHAMLPFAAQGAAMAIEDAFVLADCIATDRITTAFARYSGLRRARIARMARAARQSGRIYHLSGAMALARDVTIRAIGPRLMARQNWIYDWTP